MSHSLSNNIFKFDADGVGVIQIAFFCSNWFLTTLQNESDLYTHKQTI